MSAIDQATALVILFVGLPLGWTLIWAIVRYVSRRWP
jgi:hypothetical protein